MLKCCSNRFMPPKKKHIPMTKSRFDSMLPIRDVCTTITLLWTRAMMPTINSTAFLINSFGQFIFLNSVELSNQLHLPERGIQKTSDCLSSASCRKQKGTSQPNNMPGCVSDDRSHIYRKAISSVA